MSLKLLKSTLPKRGYRGVMGEGISRGRMPRNSGSRVDSLEGRWRMHHPCQGAAGGASSMMDVDTFWKELMQYSTRKKIKHQSQLEKTNTYNATTQVGSPYFSFSLSKI